MRIRDGTNFDPGSGLGKIRIRDEHPGSATVVEGKLWPRSIRAAAEAVHESVNSWAGFRSAAGHLIRCPPPPVYRMCTAISTAG
jgi:hypothetical protein